MREYKIKRGHNPDIKQLISTYFDANGDIHQGVIFEVEGIGEINMKHEKNSLFVEDRHAFFRIGTYDSPTS